MGQAGIWSNAKINKWENISDKPNSWNKSRQVEKKFEEKRHPSVRPQNAKGYYMKGSAREKVLAFK